MATTRSAGRDGGARKRRRRCPEEIIADLERRIDEVKRREETRRLKRSAAVRAALAAVRALDRGLEAAEQEGDMPLRHALADAREPLAHLLGERGIAAERVRPARGARPR